jgi:hypothetical protein
LKIYPALSRQDLEGEPSLIINLDALPWHELVSGGYFENTAHTSHGRVGREIIRYISIATEDYSISPFAELRITRFRERDSATIHASHAPRRDPRLVCARHFNRGLCEEISIVRARERHSCKIGYQSGLRASRCQG